MNEPMRFITHERIQRKFPYARELTLQKTLYEVELAKIKHEKAEYNTSSSQHLEVFCVW